MLEAEPGDYITIARKAKGKNEWFVGAITDENARTATIPFDFLPDGKKYIATIYEDGKDADWEKNPQSYHIFKAVVNRNWHEVAEQLSVLLRPLVKKGYVG